MKLLSNKWWVRESLYLSVNGRNSRICKPSFFIIRRFLDAFHSVKRPVRTNAFTRVTSVIYCRRKVGV